MFDSSQPFSLDTLVDIDFPSEARLSPDGKTVAFVFSRPYKPDKDTPHQKSIHFVDTATREMRQLEGTAAATNDLPRWAPDGSGRLAFLSNRDNKDEMQLYLCTPDGATERLTDLRGCVGSPSWSLDGRAIAFLYDGDIGDKRPEPDPVVVDAEPVFARIWVIDVQSRELRPVTPADSHIFEYAWSPDGSAFAVLASSHPNPAEAWYSAQPYVVARRTGEMRQLCAVKQQIGRLAWSPDGDSVAYVAGTLSDQGNVSGEVYTVSSAGGQPDCLTPGLDHSVTWIQWQTRGILYGGRHIDSAIVGWIDPQNGALLTVSKGLYSINGVGPQEISAAANGMFAAVRESFDEPPNVYLGNLANGEWQRLTTLPFDRAALPPLRAESRQWAGTDGQPVQGFLIYPSDYESGKPYPLFAHVHGGPSWSYVPRYVNQWERVLTARGCLVLMPNPRGSWGRGNAFQSANVGDLGGGDWDDVMCGIDMLVAEGLADPTRLGVGGWSYAGYLTTWAVTQTDRFRCAIAGASITSYESNYAVVPNREWQTTMFGSNVYDDYDLHRSRSPMAHISNVKTPTLLVHGMLDEDAPFQQSIEFYQGLKHFGVPAQLVLYPREPHGFQERAHQIDLYRRIGEWVERYLVD